MAVNQNIYPPGAQVNKLPVYLIGIGGSEYQGHISRPEGYCWHQILYSAKGKGELKLEDSIYSLTENCYFFLPADIPHEYYPVDGSWDVRWVAFDGFACNDIFRELGLTDSVIFRTENPETLTSYIQQDVCCAEIRQDLRQLHLFGSCISVHS